MKTWITKYFFYNRITFTKRNTVINTTITSDNYNSSMSKETLRVKIKTNLTFKKKVRFI